LYQREGIDASPVRGATISVPNGSFQPFSQRWSGLNWESNDVDALGIGLEHIAGNDIWMTQIYVTLTLGEPQVRPVDTFTASASGDGASGQVALNWLTPSYGIYDRTVIRRGSAGCPTSPAAGTGVVIKYDGLGGVGSYVDMPPHGTYYYSAFVVDADGHASKEACLVATTFDRTIEPREWVYSTSDPMPALATPGFRTLPGIAYMVTNDGRVHAMMGGDAGTGGGSWPSGWKPFHLPTIAPNRPPVAPLPSGQWAALLGGEDGRVYAIDSTSGALLWRSARLGPMISSSPAAMFTLFGASQNLIFIGTRNSGGPNQLYALDPNDGTVVWTFDPGTGANSMGMMTNGPTFDYNTEHLYFSSYRGGSGNTLWCLDLSGGSPAQCGLWPDYGVPVSLSDIDVSPVLFAGYLVVSDTTAGDLYVVNPTDGSSLLIGSAGTGGAIGFVFPRFGTTDVIVSSSTDVQSVDVTPPGTSHWNWGVPSPSTPLQAPYTDDIYVGRTDGKLHQLSTLAPGGPGTTLCVGDCLNTVVGSPTYDVVKDMIYVGTIDGEIYAVKTPY
jgi:outer membrane protein assembly factor BamB